MSIRLLMAARVVGDDWPAPDVRALAFAPVHRPTFPSFTAGDHVQVQHENGLRRDYSLISSPDDTSTYRIAVRRDDFGRGGSLLFHDDLAVGDLIFVSYPQAGMKMAEDTTHHMLIAGGIGVTAVIGLLKGLPAGHTAEVHYCVREEAERAFVDEISAAGATLSVYKSSTGGRLNVARLLAPVRENTTVYHCGPPSLMKAIDEASAHWPERRVRSESFTGVAVKGEKFGEPFDAWLVLSKRVIHVTEQESLLQAMLRENVPLDYSCEGGACGSCIVEIVEGPVEHRDLCLSADERKGTMTACVSRGIGAISLQA